MSFKFLFGNVDKTGKLEDDSLAEIKESLDTEASADYLSNVFQSVDFLKAPNDATEDKERITHDESAVDYSDINEAIDLGESRSGAIDLVLPSGSMTSSQPIQAPSQGPSVQSTDNYTYTPAQLQQMFPTYSSGRLQFSSLFSTIPPKRPYKSKIVIPKKSIKYIQDDSYRIEGNQVELFYSHLPPRPAKSSIDTHASTVDAQLESDLMPVQIESWENDIVWDDDNDAKVPSASMDVDEPKPIETSQITKPTTLFRNNRLESEDWLGSIVWDESGPARPIKFHLDDPRLPLTQDIIEQATATKKGGPTFYMKRPDGKMVELFNISDDHLYEAKKDKKDRVRQSYGPAIIIHSPPAIKLHTQYFKPMIPVRELRSFHRPSIKFPTQQDITFSRVKAIKKSKLKDVDPLEQVKCPKDLTIKDTSKYVLIEYSEEYPPVLQNVGMASLIYNYYRKKDEKDSFVPKSNHGGAYVLESVDASPFFGFGDVAPGQTLPVLYNNLFRAPLFPHPPNKCDFLVIRVTTRGKVKYHIRVIPAIYVAGQTFPIQVVPKPHARKVTQTLKMRMQVVSWRFIRADSYGRLSFPRLCAAFPMFTEEQMRVKLREYAQYLKKGENTGWWKLKANCPCPDEDSIRKFLTPEMVCLYESTLVGQQRLKDAGYENQDLEGKEIENEDEDNENADIELQLAPWTITKNFVTAAQNKGMLRLFGPGDPTGCGQGFSFIRASMKEMFFRQAESRASRSAFVDAKKQNTFHKYSIAEQQMVYKAEVARIWNNQLQSLSASTESTAKADAEEKELEKLKSRKQNAEAEEENQRRLDYGYSNASSPAPFSPPRMNDDTGHYSDAEKEDATSVAGSLLAGKNKMLVINRLIKGQNGKMEWKSEVITDPRVMNAYLRYRKIIEQDNNQTTGIQYTDEDKVKILKKKTKAQVVKLQIKQGKTPTYTDIDISEGAVIANPKKGDSEPKSMPVILKLASLPPPSEPKKRKESHMESQESGIPLHTKRRGSPEVELATILEKILQEIIEIPEAWPFVRPVAASIAPGYYDIIKKPKALENIRDDIRNFNYKNSNEFLADVQLVHDNCVAYNGPEHSLTAVIKNLVQKVQDNVKKNEEALKRYENDILVELGIAPKQDVSSDQNTPQPAIENNQDSNSAQG